MAEEPNAVEKTEARLAQQIGTKAARKLLAQRNPAPGVWFGLGLMGVVGWSVVVPTLLGAALGIWLDRHRDSEHAFGFTRKGAKAAQLAQHLAKFPIGQGGHDDKTPNP